MDLSKDELLECVIRAFAGTYRISDINTTSSNGSIRLSINGHRLRVSLNGLVETVGNGVLISDLTASLAGLALKPFILDAKSM